MTTQPEINVPLLEKTMEHIEHVVPSHTEVRTAMRDGAEFEGIEAWGQGDWIAEIRQFVPIGDRDNQLLAAGEVCGTAMCFAGWACSISGDKFAKDAYGEFDGCVVFEDGETMPIQVRARELLGLTFVEANDLFAPDNDIHDLKILVEELKNADPRDRDLV